MPWAIPQPFETVEHTADTGVRVRGATREETLARLVLGHAQLLCAGAAPEATETVSLEVEVGEDAALVGVDVLREMNRLFCTRRVIAREVTAVEWSGAGVRIEVVVGPYDADAHNEGVDIKAVTFHEARFERDGDEFVAQVILDV
jgi:SHS2 domain-containing protein